MYSNRTIWDDNAECVIPGMEISTRRCLRVWCGAVQIGLCNSTDSAWRQRCSHHDHRPRHPRAQTTLLSHPSAFLSEKQQSKRPRPIVSRKQAAGRDAHITSNHGRTTRSFSLLNLPPLSFGTTKGKSRRQKPDNRILARLGWRLCLSFVS